MTTSTLLILIVVLPLVAATTTAALGPRLLRGQSHWPVVAAVLLSFVASAMLVFRVQERIDRCGKAGASPRAADCMETATLWSWARVNAASPLPGRGDFRVDVAIRTDPLSAVMLTIVTGISSLVLVYSIGYMRGDPGYWRFFTYVGLFVFSMNVLVSANNFLVLYAGWELVGLCSYLLIGFWYEKPTAAAAGMKAFLTNRVGDVGLALGIFLIWATRGTLDFDAVLTPPGGVVGGAATTAVCLLLLLGACGKSAQFPLHVWLPDAMEGPTPVSALIHAATMVTAGVYMIVRCAPLFAASAAAQYVVAAVGGVTALLGAVIALTQTDLKRILAYSTISHLGYMFVAIGVGTLAGATAGMFHLLTHAFFKALLFLGAGSVMHAMGGVVDIRRIGGLRRRMPITYATFLIGCLAIAGVAPLAGFWSKDAILLALRERSLAGRADALYEILLVSMIAGIVLIDFYTFRPFFRVFHGPERIPAEAGHHAHESPPTMTAPLVALAFGSAVVGAYFEWTHGFARFLAATPSLACLRDAGGAASAESPGRWGMMILSTALTVAGIAASAFVYLGKAERSENRAARLARWMNVFGLYTLSYQKFFFDLIYATMVIRPFEMSARLAAWFDRRVIDAVVDGVGRLPVRLKSMLRPAQNGLVPFYALMMSAGVLALLLAFLR